MRCVTSNPAGPAGKLIISDRRDGATDVWGSPDLRQPGLGSLVAGLDVPHVFDHRASITEPLGDG